MLPTTKEEQIVQSEVPHILTVQTDVKQSVQNVCVYHGAPAGTVWYHRSITKCCVRVVTHAAILVEGL